VLVGFGGIVLLVWPDLTSDGAAGRQFAIGMLSLQVACLWVGARIVLLWRDIPHIFTPSNICPSLSCRGTRLSIPSLQYFWERYYSSSRSADGWRGDGNGTSGNHGSVGRPDEEV